ncbi:MAG TPA: hypothetical protein DFJ59_02295 [Alphaproteobacteria bacterium]|nr:hypothetical protein [Alphaproteobacteria bacterium]
MLRLGIFIAALIAVFIAALSLTPRLLTPNVYRAQALVGLTRALGQPVTAGEDAAIRLLPRPRLQLTDVRVLGDGNRTDDVLLAADTATFDLRPRALASGRIVVEAVDLDRPVIFLTRAEDRSVTFGAAPLFSGLSGQSETPATLSLLNLSDGELLYVDEPLGQSLRLGIDDLRVERVDGYAFEAKGRVLAGQAPYEVDIAFVPTANPRGERGFDIDVRGEAGRRISLSGAIDDKFTASLIVREDLGWKLRAEGFRHPLLGRIGLDDGPGITVESRVLSDQEGYDLPGLTLSLANGQQIRGKARLSPSPEQNFLDLILSGNGITLATAAANLPVRDWTALLPGAVADLGGLGLRFDISAQDLSLRNGTGIERLTVAGALTAADGLRLRSLRAKTDAAVSFDLDRLIVAGSDELEFAGRITADDPSRLISDPDRAELARSLGRLNFEGEVELIDGALAVTSGRVETNQGGFSVDGAPFSLDAVTGLGAARLSVDVETLDLSTWAPALDVHSVPELAEQGRVLTERMRALGAGSLSIRASTATLGLRIFREFEAEVEPLGDRSQVLDVHFLDEDGNHVHAITRFDETGESLRSGQVEIVLSDRPRSAERALSRYAPAALDYDLLTRALDALALDRLVLLRPTADRPWELSLISDDSDLSATMPDADGNQTWSFTTARAADLFTVLGLPTGMLDPDAAPETSRGAMVSGRLSGDGEFAGIGTVLGADLTLSQRPTGADAPNTFADATTDAVTDLAGPSLQLSIDHPEALDLLTALGLGDISLPSGQPATLNLVFMTGSNAADRAFSLDLALGDGVKISGKGRFNARTQTLSFIGEADRITGADWLAALSSGSGGNLLSPLVAGLSGEVALSIGRLDAGELGQIEDAALALSFTPGRYIVNRLEGRIVGSPLGEGGLSLNGDVLVGQDVFADLSVAITDARPVFRPAAETALTFDTLTLSAESFQARAADFAGLLAAGAASFEVDGRARLELALTAMNAAGQLYADGPWRAFLTGPQGISAYEDLRGLFFDGAAALTGLVQMDVGALTTSTLTLAGRRGTLLAKGQVSLEGWAAAGLDGAGPARIELYSAEDAALVEQVLLIVGPVADPSQLSVER